MQNSVASSRIIFFLSTAMVLVVAPNRLSAQDNSQTQDTNSKQEIKYSQDPNASKNMTLLLKDYDPKSMMHAESHEVPRAKFPVIDMHNHVNDAGGIHGEAIPPEEVVRRMDRANVEK